MASHGTIRQASPTKEAIEARVLTGALFVACLPISVAQWIVAPADRAQPLAAALTTARDAVAQIFSLPG